MFTNAANGSLNIFRVNWPSRRGQLSQYPLSSVNDLPRLLAQISISCSVSSVILADQMKTQFLNIGMIFVARDGRGRVRSPDRSLILTKPSNSHLNKQTVSIISQHHGNWGSVSASCFNVQRFYTSFSAHFYPQLQHFQFNFT